MPGYTLLHVIIPGLGGSDEQRFVTLTGKAFSAGTLAGTRPAKYQDKLFFDLLMFHQSSPQTFLPGFLPGH